MSKLDCMSNKLFINCFPRVTPFLSQEVESLGYEVLETDRMGIYLEGTYEDTYRLNYCLRTASKVLYEVAAFKAATPDELYSELMQINWEDILPDKGYISIGGFVRNDHIKDHRFAFMKTKDAIVDRMQAKTGARPDSGPRNDKTVLFLHWHKKEVTISIDTSGETLTKHGYRKLPGKAPMMEPLAAAALLATRWDMKGPLVNPMCGSGTLAIEAALMLQHTYPGHFRSNFGFMYTRLFDSAKWEKVKESLESERVSNNSSFPPIIASDHDQKALQAAQMNAKAAGVDHMIDFQHSDFRKTKLPSTNTGIIILNPEYGERLGQQENLRATYQAIGDFFKKECAGYTGYIFTGNLDLAKSVGLRASRRIEFYNARIDCRLLEYELYTGTRR